MAVTRTQFFVNTPYAGVGTGDLVVAGQVPTQAEWRDYLFFKPQAEIEKRGAAMRSLLTAPSLSIVGATVQCAAVSAIVDGYRLSGSATWDFSSTGSGTYYLQLDSFGASHINAVQNSAQITLGTAVCGGSSVSSVEEWPATNWSTVDEFVIGNPAASNDVIAWWENAAALSGTRAGIKRKASDGKLYFTIDNGSTWTELGGGGSGSPDGPTKAVQFNSGSGFGGDGSFTWDNITSVLNVVGEVSAESVFANGGTFISTLDDTALELGSRTTPRISFTNQYDEGIWPPGSPPGWGLTSFVGMLGYRCDAAGDDRAFMYSFNGGADWQVLVDLTGVGGGGGGGLTTVAETDLNFTDITTADSSTSKHGLLPKLPGGTSKYLREDGTWVIPAGGGGGNVTGTGVTTVGHFAKFNATDATIIEDAGYGASSFDVAGAAMTVNTALSMHISIGVQTAHSWPGPSTSLMLADGSLLAISALPAPGGTF